MRRRHFLQITSSLCGLFVSSHSYAQESRLAFKGVFLTNKRIEELDKRVQNKVEPNASAFEPIWTLCDRMRLWKPHVPKHWYVPGYYKDAKGHEKAKRALMDDANWAYQFALCYRMTDVDLYANAAVRILDAWATGVESMSTKDDSTLSFSYHFPAMIFAADLMKDSPYWPKENQEKFKTFVRERALPMNTMSRDNNWGNWGLVLVMASAAYMKDKALFRQGVYRWKEFIETQIADDGHLPHEVNRSGGMRGIWYSHFCLMPQTIAAEIAKVNGIDLYDFVSPSGHTLKKAYEKVAYWSKNPGEFPYFDGKPEEMKGADYYGYFEILYPHWPNADAKALLLKGRPFTARHSAPLLTFTHGEPLEER